MKIVKNLREAQEKGYIGDAIGSSPNPQQTGNLGSILKEINNLIQSVKELKGIKNPQQQEQQPSPQYPQMNVNENKTEISKKSPLAILEVDEQLLDNFIDNIFNREIKEEQLNLTLREVKEKWEVIKEIAKPMVKENILKIVKTKIEWK